MNAGGAPNGTHEAPSRQLHASRPQGRTGRAQKPLLRLHGRREPFEVGIFRHLGLTPHSTLECFATMPKTRRIGLLSVLVVLSACASEGSGGGAADSGVGGTSGGGGSNTGGASGSGGIAGGSGGSSGGAGGAGGSGGGGGAPTGWTCAPKFYGDAHCDCGCGLVDKDCADATVDACEFCDDSGSCSEAACPGSIDPNNNATCV